MHHCLLIRRARLISHKALALSSLALAAMLLSSPAAHADGWLLHVALNGTPTATGTNSGGGSVSVPPYTVPGDSTNSLSLPSYSIGCVGGAGGGGTASCDAAVNLSVTITGSWQGTSPPPPSVKIIETGNASYNGSGNSGVSGVLNDGVSDPPVTTSTSGIAQTPAATPPPHITVETGSPWTITRTFSASGHAQTTAPQFGGSGCSINASINSYTVTVHAQPYNFHQTYVGDNGNGTLSFTYQWLSTDGKLGDIGAGCVVHEFVTYSGPDPFVFPAPFTGASPNPTVLPDPPQPGSAGVIYDDQLMVSTAKPYQSASAISTQKWEYDDSDTGEKDVIVPGPDSGPLTITRTITVRPPYIPYWWYSVNKNGSTAWTPLTGQ